MFSELKSKKQRVRPNLHCNRLCQRKDRQSRGCFAQFIIWYRGKRALKWRHKASALELVKENIPSKRNDHLLQLDQQPLCFSK